MNRNAAAYAGRHGGCVAFWGLWWGKNPGMDCFFWGLCGVKAIPACTFRLGEKYPKPTVAANLCMRGGRPGPLVS